MSLINDARHCLQERDVEGNWARMPAWKAILYGPLFIIRQHSAALRSKGRFTICLELAARIRATLPEVTFKEVF